MLFDTHNRLHNYLRISVTDNCNFRCFYCMPEEDHLFTPNSRLMQAKEIEEIASTFVRLGVSKIRLTGGEPLVRKDIGQIIQAIAKLPVELTMTTNGTRLQELSPVFQEAGMRSINISLDTLQREKFKSITRRDSFQLVYENIHAMIELGIHVKVNVVAMKGVNDDEILDFINWTKNTPVHIRFIEFMPFTGNNWMNAKVLGWQELLFMIGEQYDFLPLKGGANDTAKAYIVPGHAGTFAVISTMTSPFCSTCNRLRLTADGKLKNCLFSKEETDLLTALRNGTDIEPLIRNSVKAKAAERGGQFLEKLENLNPAEIQNRSMIAIGG